jgi:hypothetical protein
LCSHASTGEVDGLQVADRKEEEINIIAFQATTLSFFMASTLSAPVIHSICQAEAKIKVHLGRQCARTVQYICFLHML